MRQLIDERKLYPAMLLLVVGLCSLALATFTSGPVLLAEKTVLLVLLGIGSLTGGVSLFIRSVNKA